jgi:hypothetical protein
MEKCKICNTELIKQDVQSFGDELGKLLVTYECPNCHFKTVEIEHIY